ncbi:Tetratricopeptide repeat protein [Paragonimus heterotremus]|uniref:Tetratricopeptide repeat protein n=1 Tax=Paragonimus heterotremus TaxID=100268 RepID=A0A8J4T5X8_9TREM|nr:Tetratricopeptide repeat protein [Paragonimus heterotremus]
MEFLDSKLPDSAVEESKASFYQAKNAGLLNENTQFRYALDLLKTNRKANLDLAIDLLEGMILSILLSPDLFKRTKDDGFRRDCLFYLAVAYTKLSEYERAMECCDNILKVQPQNHQTMDLKQEILRRIKRDGATGIAVISGAVLGAAALIGIGLGLGLSRKK